MYCPYYRSTGQHIKGQKFQDVDSTTLWVADGSILKKVYPRQRQFIPPDATAVCLLSCDYVTKDGIIMDIHKGDEWRDFLNLGFPKFCVLDFTVLLFF